MRIGHKQVFDKRIFDTVVLDLTIVIPTLNERNNLAPLVQKIKNSLDGIEWEIVFVDDESHDGTLEEILRINRQEPRVRFIERIGRRGLSSACIEGFMTTSADLVAVMDADHQHDEKRLSEMVEILQDQPEVDLVIGSRFVEGGGVGDWAPGRLAMSRLGKWFSGFILPSGVSDPMSGFFMARRPFLWNLVPQLSGQGFKVLADLLAASKDSCRFVEIPFEFGERFSGESKLNLLVIAEFAAQIFEKLFGGYMPVQFVRFLLVGSVGMLIHMLVLSVLLFNAGIVFWAAQTISALIAMTTNFSLNNMFTYQDNTLSKDRAFWGLLLFYVLCGGGFLINMAIAINIYDRGGSWLVAGGLGGVVGSVWNYSTNTAMTWGARKRRGGDGIK